MKTIDYFLMVIREDEELKDLIKTSGTLHLNYKPRKLSKSKAGLAFSHFWDSTDGAKFRMLVEKKYLANLNYSVERGKIKTALKIYFAEVVNQ